MAFGAPTARGCVLAIWMLAGGVYAPKVTPQITNCISEGAQIKDGKAILDVVKLTALAPREHNFCSEESPCWLASVGPLNGIGLASADSNAILRRYCSGPDGPDSCPQAEKQKTRVHMVRAVHRLSPWPLCVPPLARWQGRKPEARLRLRPQVPGSPQGVSMSIQAPWALLLLFELSMVASQVATARARGGGGGGDACVLRCERPLARAHHRACHVAPAASRAGRIRFIPTHSDRVRRR